MRGTAVEGMDPEARAEESQSLEATPDAGSTESEVGELRARAESGRGPQRVLNKMDVLKAF